MARAVRTAMGPYMCELERALKRLFERRRYYTRFLLDYDDYLDMFAWPADHEALRKVGQLTQSKDDEFVFTWPNSDIQLEVTVLRCGDEHPPLRYRKPTLISNKPQLIERLRKWVEQRRQLGIEFARTEKVLKELNEHCRTPGQVRYYWPAILSLCEQVGIASYYEAFVEPHGKGAPPLPVELRGALREAAGTITASLLVAEPPSIWEPAPVEIKFRAYSKHCFKDPTWGWLNLW